MPVYLRMFYYKRLIKAYDDEKKEYDKQMSKHNQSNPNIKK